MQVWVKQNSTYISHCNRSQIGDKGAAPPKHCRDTRTGSGGLTNTLLAVFLPLTGNVLHMRREVRMEEKNELAMLLRSRYSRHVQRVRGRRYQINIAVQQAAHAGR